MELWITGLPFIPQVMLVLAVVVPASFLAAGVLDRLVGRVVALVFAAAGRRGKAEQPLAGQSGRRERGGEHDSTETASGGGN